MEASKAEFEAMLEAPEADHVRKYDYRQRTVGRKDRPTFSIWGVHSSNLSNPEVRKIQAEWEPKVSAFFSELSLDARYFQRVKYLYDQRANLNLDAKQMRCWNGHMTVWSATAPCWTRARKAQVISIETDLAKKFSAFRKRCWPTRKPISLLTDEAELAGLPESYVAAMQAAAKSKGKTGWAVVNTRSAVQPFLENSTRRDLREKVWRAFTKRGDNGNANDTNATIAEILKLRQQRAEILGFPTHAHYRMADTMAKDPDRAMDLMMKVWPAAVARVKEEVADMQAIANADKITIEPWDYRFYAEKVRKAKYDLDQEAIKPYFQLDNMVAAMFDAAGKLYGMSFTENTRHGAGVRTQGTHL